MSSKRLLKGASTQIITMIREGLPYREIANAFDIDPSTVSYYAVRAGLARQGHAKPSVHDPSTRVPDDMPAGFLFDTQPWADRALCNQTDPDSFYPDKGESTREAKTVCASCTVAAECLTYALDHHEQFGIWGGLSARERRHINKKHRETA